MPKVLNFHKHGKPAGSVYIGRNRKGQPANPFGNPFTIPEDGNRQEVIEKFEAWFMGQPGLIERARRELKGRDLVCFCSPQACHGDVLLKIANMD